MDDVENLILCEVGRITGADLILCDASIAQRDGAMDSEEGEFVLNRTSSSAEAPSSSVHVAGSEQSAHPR